jgi:hypothetical protein
VPWAAKEDSVAKLGSHIYLLFTKVYEGREAEFNHWYDTVHIPEMLTRCTGFVAAQRFRLCDAQRPGSMPAHTHLCIYEIEGDPRESLTSMDEQAAQPDWTRTDTFDYSAFSSRLYETITEHFEAAEILSSARPTPS